MALTVAVLCASATPRTTTSAQSPGPRAVEDAERIRIATAAYTLDIAKQKFRYGFHAPGGDVIAPGRGFAMVNMEKGVKVVRVLPGETVQGVASATAMPALYHFIGSPKEIYAAFLEARRREGYPFYRSKYEFFGVGWEAFGALGWNINEQTVTENVERYLSLGIGGKGVLVLRDLPGQSLTAWVYPVAPRGSTYRFTHRDGSTRSTITNANTGWNAVAVTDVTASQPVVFSRDDRSGAIRFPLTPGHDYQLHDRT